jgi:hypothetical protein
VRVRQLRAVFLIIAAVTNLSRIFRGSCGLLLQGIDIGSNQGHLDGFATACKYRFGVAMATTQSSIRKACWMAGTAAVLFFTDASYADEGGVSFWLPGQYASLAATPQLPGWAMGVVYLHSNVGGSGTVAASKEITVGRIPANVNVNLNLSLSAQADLVVLSPTYTLATPVFGGQFSLGVASWFGQSAGSIAGTLTALAGPIVATRSGVLSDSLTSYATSCQPQRCAGTRVSTTTWST